MTTTVPTTTGRSVPERPAPGRSANGGGPRVARRTPDGWTDEPYRNIGVHPYGPLIGAEITGVDLTRPLDDDTFAELHRALLEWKVLFVRDAGLDRRAHHDLARRWGPLESHPFSALVTDNQSDEAPEVFRFEKGPGAAGYENVWHSDVTWRECPSLGSLLHALEVPALGGDTLWADMGAAYDCLSDELKARIDGLEAVHDWWDTFGRAMRPEQREALRDRFPPARHPVVRTHPETGRRTLFVNAIFTDHIVGMDPDEGAALLDLLHRQAAYPEYQCRFRWAAGSLAIWDNRSTQHYAASDYYPQRRVMERVTVCGDRPY